MSALASRPAKQDCRTPRQTASAKPPRLFQAYERNENHSNAEAIKNYREYTSNGYKPSDLMSKEEEIRLEDIAKNHVPRTLREAIDAIEIVQMPKKIMLDALQTLNVKVGDLKIVYCREILASKLVQRQLCVSTVLDCIDDFDMMNPSLANERHHRLRRLPETVARGPEKKKKDEECIYWISGDIPLYDKNGNIIPGMPSLEEVLARLEQEKSQLESTQNDPVPEKSTEKVEENPPPFELVNVAAEETHDDNSEVSDDTPPFEDGEYCRLLHVLADKRVAPVLSELRNSQLREKPWASYVAPVFNDKRFRPVPIRAVSGGVKRRDIVGLYPRFICERDGEYLQQKFAEFRSLYRAAVRGYVQWGDDQSHTFADFCQSKRYIMYAFCLLENFPQLEPLTLRPEETKAEARKRTRNASKRPVTMVDLEVEDDLAETQTTPVAKRAKAAMLGDKERDELKKIIEGGVPEDLGSTFPGPGGQLGLNPPMTKSEEIQLREREEKDKAMYDAIAQSGGVDSGGLLWCLLRSAPGSAKFTEIEDRLREKILTELRHAQDLHLVSLLTGLREAHNLSVDMRDPQEASLIASAKDHILRNLRSNLRCRQENGDVNVSQK
ncbi:unnamed protein product [Agarophyton chilense]